jgi:predicted amidohydrolase YtcJ
LRGLGLAAAHVDLRGCESAAACVERLGAPAAGAKTWLIGRGWDQNRFAGGAFPDKAALDRVHPGRAVWLLRIDGHAGWASSAALALSGISAATKDPSGGRIVRDARGEPTGVLVDNAMKMIDAVMPAPDEAEIEAAILRAQQLALEAGLTGVHEMGIDQRTIEIYRRLERKGRLKLRVRAYADRNEAELLFRGKRPALARDGRFTLLGVKLYADGALGSRGAALLETYADDAANRGLLLLDHDAVAELAKRARAGGWQLAIHAIGDRANREVIQGFEAAGVTTPDRFRIEHLQVIALADLPRLAKTGAIASMQPTHATSDHRWVEARLGAGRIEGAYAWRKVLEAKVPLAFGSDFPVEKPTIANGIVAAVERGGWTLGERLTLDETLRAFSLGAAYAAFEEEWRGRARVGYAGDFTIFDGPLDALGHAGKTRVHATIVAGEVLFEAK